MNADPKDWKLFRCIYDEMGQFAIEGEGDGSPFEKALAKDYGSVGWIIGQSINYRGSITIKVVLEGSKEVLEYVLGLVREN